MLETRSAVGRWVLGATILASAVVFLDATGITVTLPAIQRDFGTSLGALQWVNNAYLVTLTAFILIGGSIGDVFGRRRAFVAGLAGFALGSVLCALAPTLGLLVVARSLQGLGGALLMPGSLAIITASFVETERGAAIGRWAAISGVGAAVGPFIAGALVDSLSWRWFFAINLPAIVVVALIAVWFIPESRDEAPGRRLDLAGAITAAVGLGALTYALIDAPVAGWAAPRTIVAMITGAAALIAFLILQAREATPMMPISMFSHHTFAGANAATFGIYFALGGLFFYAALYLQQAQGFSATAAGAALTPITLLLLVGSARAGRLADRIGPRIPLTAGPAVCAAGLFVALRSGVDSQYWTTLFPALLIFGVGLTLTVAPLTAAVLSSVEQRRAGVASGINNAIARMGGLVAVAILPAIALGAFRSSLRSGLAQLPLADSTRAAIESMATDQGGLRAPAGLPETVTNGIGNMVRISFVSGFRLVMTVCALALLVSAAVAFLTVGRERGAKSRESEPCPPPTICGPGTIPRGVEA